MQGIDTYTRACMEMNPGNLMRHAVEKQVMVWSGIGRLVGNTDLETSLKA